MSQPVQPPNQPQQPYGGQPADGNPYAAGPGAAAPATPTGNPYGDQPPAPTNNPYGDQPPASTGNPYGDQPPASTGNPFGNPQGQPAPFGGGAPFAPAPPASPVRNGLALGVLVAFGAAVVASIVYGVLLGSIEREFGYAAIGVGFLVGFAAAKLGGANPVTIAAAAVFSVGAVYFGQLIGYAMVMADAAQVSFSEVFLDHFDTVTRVWKEDADFMRYVFIALGAIAAIGGAKKAN
ncbi:translation initiation factor IF-2 [Streptomyces sp. CBMAI 2042]|uniref:hypothetical protein n=1 Tax=Streptomyces sp. CBMAI 2042 TaxID=2305222 RepID=UPI000F23F2F0|nr:hypothetical protein [Streptomyces sp. CBMAI 2042]RLV68977.1 translation initiation factor IF-2 [Streptomyces sp. CBMAI 2042]